MADEIKITSEVELQDGVKEGTETENKKVGKSKTKEKVAETLKKVGKTDDAVGEVGGEEEEVEEKDIDLFSESAMFNAYSICHNVQVGRSDWDSLHQQFQMFRISCTSGDTDGREWSRKRRRRRRNFKPSCVGVLCGFSL